MAKTCADCKYHECNSKCIKKENACDGVCTKHQEIKRCYKTACSEYELDRFYMVYTS